VDCDVPWVPSVAKPPEDGTVIQLGLDPFFSRYPMRSYPCDVPIVADPAVALPMLAAAVRRRARPEAVAARRERLAAAHRTNRARWAEAARADRSRVPTGFQWASRCLRDVLGPDTFTVNEYPLDLRHAPPPAPSSYLGSPPSGGLGWGF